MQLITNRIHTGSPGRFEDFIKKFREENQVKTASSKEEVKVAAEQEEADSSGQLDVEPLHQEGESTTMPKAGPSAKKDDGEKAAAADTDPEKEGKDSGQPKAEGSEKFTNDPKVPSKEEKGGGTKEEVKEAGNLPEALEEHKFKKKDEGDEEEEKEDKDKEEKEAEKKPQFVKWANLDSKNKAFLTKYWKQLFGDDYVNALVADK